MYKVFRLTTRCVYLPEGIRETASIIKSSIVICWGWDVEDSEDFVVLVVDADSAVVE